MTSGMLVNPIDQRRLRREAERGATDPLNSLNFCIGCAYSNYLGLLERLLAEIGIEKHIAPGMGPILFALFEEDNDIIKNIGERVRLAPSTLSSLLSRMEKHGVVKRYRDKKDGRAVRIKLTPLGRSFEPPCRALLDRLRRQIQTGLTDDEVETLRALLSRVIDNLRTVA